MTALALMLLACKRPAPPEMIVSDRVIPSGPVRETIDGPYRWNGAGGLCVDLPQAWSGTTGAAPNLLQVQHAGSGVELALFAWPWGTPLPRVPAGFTLGFHDEDSYRTVPLLFPGASYTLVGDDGSVIQGWYGPVDGRVVVVEVAAPFGRTTEGRDIADDLLRSVKRCDG